MTDILQDVDGDIAVTKNDLKFVNGQDEVVQLLRQRLRTFLGEWFLDTTIGVPYIQEIFKKRPNPVSIDAAFKNEILNCPGVLELSRFEADVDPALRRLTISCEVVGTEGIIDFSEVIES